MGKSSELFIRMQQHQIKNLKDVPEHLIKEIQNRNPQITLKDRKWKV